MDTLKIHEDDKYVRLSKLSSEIKEHETAVSNARESLEKLPVLTVVDPRLRSQQQESRSHYEQEISKNENAASEKRRLYEALEAQIQAEINTQNANWEENKRRRLQPAEEEHVPEPVAQPGLFTRFARWIKRKFSSGEPVTEQPVVAEVVVEHEQEQINVEDALTPSQIRQNKLAELEAKEAEYREDALRNEQEEKQLIQEKYKGKRPHGIPQGTHRLDDLDLEYIRRHYISKNWSIREFENGREVIKRPYDFGASGSEGFEGELKRELIEFFTILENGKNITDAINADSHKGPVRFEGGVSYSKVINDLLLYKDDIAIRKAIPTLLGFSVPFSITSYPLETWDSEKRLEMLWHMESIMDRVRQQRVFAEKFLMQAASDSLKEEITRAIRELDVIEGWAKHIGGEEGPFSYKEYFDKTIAHLDDDKEHYKYKEKYDLILEYTEEESVVSEPEVALATMMDESDAQEYISDVCSFAVLTKTGRARLLGNEKPDEIIAFGLDDLTYYRDILHKAKLVKKYVEMHPESRCLDEQTKASLDTARIKAAALESSLSSRLKNNGAIGYAQIEAKSVKGIEDKFWYLRQLNSEMDKYEEAGGEYHKAIPEINMYEASELKQKKYTRINYIDDKKIPTQLITNYQKLMKEFVAGNIDYSKMNRRQKNLYDIGGIYTAKIYGPKALYEKLLKSVSSRFDDDGMCALILLWNEELKKNNSMEDNKEYYAEHMNDSRILPCYIDGYSQNEDGEPLNDDERKIKELDSQRIKSYETDDEFRINEIKHTIDGLLEMERDLDPDCLTKEKMLENLYFVSEVGMIGMMVMNLREDPRNAEYFETLSEEQIEEIKLHIETLCMHMSNLVSIYCKLHSFSAQQGYTLYREHDLESLDQDTLEEQYKVQLQAILDILKKRKEEDAKNGEATGQDDGDGQEVINPEEPIPGSEEIYL